MRRILFRIIPESIRLEPIFPCRTNFTFEDALENARQRLYRRLESCTWKFMQRLPPQMAKEFVAELRTVQPTFLRKVALEEGWIDPSTHDKKTVLSVAKQRSGPIVKEEMRKELNSWAAEKHPAYIHLWEGQQYRKNRNYEDAIYACKSAIAAEPGLVDSYIEVALALQLDGQYENGLEYIDKALQMAPDNHTALLGRGQLLTILGKKEQADECLKRIKKQSRSKYYEGKIMNWLARFSQDDSI